ncbi:hypothetical protein F5Y05DRAFT_136408 [Hypoxylon sp. FL0543]|nr:hypothetical protein F5Y05DRAFT_136408 [Hypoxylon sp. FL0543]
MDNDVEYIISPDEYEMYGLSDRRRNSNREVQHFIDRGLMNQESIYQRYTQKLLKIWEVRPNGSAELEAIRRTFRQLRDLETGYLSQTKFTFFMTERLSEFGIGETSEVPMVLFDILIWHAFFPFSGPSTRSRVPCLDEDAFLRAVCLLWRDPAPRYAPNFTSPKYSSGKLTSGYWGPHFGWPAATRGKDGSDLLRRIFRSLSVPNNTNSGKTTTFLVPRFFMSQPQPEDPDGVLEQEIVVVTKEPERSVDVQDVISECPPDEDPLTANPLRESYGPVLPSLPHQQYDLTDLHVPTTRAVALLNLLHAIQPSEKDLMPDVLSLIESLGREKVISWELFHNVMLNKAQVVASALSKIVGLFKTPLDIVAA